MYSVRKRDEADPRKMVIADEALCRGCGACLERCPQIANRICRHLRGTPPGLPQHGRPLLDERGRQPGSTWRQPRERSPFRGRDRAIPIGASGTTAFVSATFTSWGLPRTSSTRAPRMPSPSSWASGPSISPSRGRGWRPRPAPGRAEDARHHRRHAHGRGRDRRGRHDRSGQETGTRVTLRLEEMERYASKIAGQDREPDPATEGSRHQIALCRKRVSPTFLKGHRLDFVEIEINTDVLELSHRTEGGSSRSQPSSAP